MLAVVETDADDLSGVRDRRQQVHRGAGVGGSAGVTQATAELLRSPPGDQFSERTAVRLPQQRPGVDDEVSLGDSRARAVPGIERDQPHGGQAYWTDAQPPCKVS